MKQRLTETVTFRVEKNILKVVDQIAGEQDRKRADVVRRIFLKGLLDLVRKTQ